MWQSGDGFWLIRSGFGDLFHDLAQKDLDFGRRRIRFDERRIDLAQDEVYRRGKRESHRLAAAQGISSSARSG